MTPEESPATDGPAERGSERDGKNRAPRDPAVQAAIDAYRRTLRNEAATSAPPPSGTSSDDRLLADRPPHWQTRTDPTLLGKKPRDASAQEESGDEDSAAPRP